MIIEDLTTAGEGVGSIEGLKVFVFGALPGEEVEVEVTERKKRYALAKLQAIKHRSKDRVDPICPHFGTCGGCQIMHLSYPAQLKWKTKRVKEALKRIGGLNVDVEPCMPSPKEWGYRHKVHFHCGGLYKRHSHEITPVKKCYIHSETGELQRQNANAKDLIVKTSSATGEVMLIKDGLPSCDSITEILAGIKFKIRPKDFFQINPFQAIHLYKKAVDLAELSPDESVIDAYCGVGGLALFAAKKAKHVHGIETVPSAVQSACENAKLNQITNVSFSCGRVGKLESDVVFLNPPRGGVEETVLYNCNSNRLVYISCDPATLARDLKLLSSKYEIEAAYPFDMFPQTTHVETVVLLKLRVQVRK